MRGKAAGGWLCLVFARAEPRRSSLPAAAGAVTGLAGFGFIGRRVYAKVDPYVDDSGTPTAEAERAAKDERTGGRLENPEHALWIQSTALQAAPIQAYVGFRLAELTVALGAAFVAAGAGLTALGRHSWAR